MTDDSLALERCTRPDRAIDIWRSMGTYLGYAVAAPGDVDGDGLADLAAGAYLTEILRAGVVSVRTSEMEAATALGMSRLQLLRYVMLPHIAKTIYAPLSNFFVWLVLGSSLAALFGVEELTGRAINVSTASLRSIETFTIVAMIYVVLTVLASGSLALVGRLAFRVKAKVF